MGVGDDKSTDIQSKVKSFAIAMNTTCAALRNARLAKTGKDAKVKDPPVVTFSFDNNPVTKSRTPNEQAMAVASDTSWVCWSAHMADKARHAKMQVNGSVNWDPKKAMGEDFEVFKKKWGEAMSKLGLKNYKGGDGWGDGDPFHFELPDSKLPKTDERVDACIAEYVRLTRKGGYKINAKFESDYKNLLEKFVKPYETKEQPLPPCKPGICPTDQRRIRSGGA
jgi:hypothetical protein